MMKYKGYYIDGVTFKSKADIENHIKNDLIVRIRKEHDLLFGAPEDHYSYGDMMALTKDISRCEKQLHDEYNMSWEEIEEIPYAG